MVAQPFKAGVQVQTDPQVETCGYRLPSLRDSIRTMGYAVELAELP